MVRLAIFGVLIGLLILLVRSYLPRANRDEDSPESMEMVQDPNCELYVPKSEAIQKTIADKSHYFCSEKCAQEYQDKSADS